MRYQNNRCRRRRPPCGPTNNYGYPFSIYKVDALTGVGIPGALFQLTDQRGGMQTAQSGVDGVVTFRLQPCTQYTLIEAVAPTGYLPNVLRYTLAVNEKGCVCVNGIPMDTLVIPNQSSLAFGLSFLKTDADTGAALPGATFTLSQNGVPVRTVVSDANGSVNFSNLPAGTYTLTETGTPDGYEANTEIYTVTVAANGGITVNGQPSATFGVTNTPTGGAATPAPTIDAIAVGDTTITGTGIAGCTVRVVFPDASEQTIVVDAEGVWTVPVPTGTVLVVDDIVTAYQTCPLAEESDPATAVVGDTPATAAIVYEPNGATGDADADVVPLGSAYSIRTLAETDFVYDGFIFTGWDTEPTGTGTAYAPGEEIDAVDLTLYAQWTPETGGFFVAYSPNGGEGTPVADDVDPDEAYTVRTLAQTDFTNAGETFTGWNTTPEGDGTAYTPGEEITVTSNLTLYAQWSGATPDESAPPTINAVTTTDTEVTGDGIANSDVTVTFPNGTEVTVLVAADDTWTAPVNGTLVEGAEVRARQTEVGKSPSEEVSQTVTAPPVDAFTISYNPNGGTGTVDEDEAPEGEEYTIRTQADTDFENGGESITSWNTAANGTGDAYIPGEEIDPIQDLTLYAQWA